MPGGRARSRGSALLRSREVGDAPALFVRRLKTTASLPREREVQDRVPPPAGSGSPKAPASLRARWTREDLSLGTSQTTTNYRGYGIVIEQDEDGCYAFAPGLNGCQSQGETMEEAEVNIKEAVDLYLESLGLAG